MSLADYLAKNYLTADNGSSESPSHSRKRKRKDAERASKPKARAANPSSSHTGLVIADDDAADTWHHAHNRDADTTDDTTPTIVGNATGSTGFRKAQKSSWTAVGGAELASSADQAAADAILASAAAENNARAAAAEAEDDAPVVVGNDEDNDHDGSRSGSMKSKSSGAYMESGAKAGLQTAAEVTAALERRKAEEARRFRDDDPATTGKGQETIYRDATGRIVNVAMKRAEARRAAEEAERTKALELDAQKGDVQRVEREERRRALDDAKYISVARYADDVQMNEELKEQERWNDPAAQFLTKKKAGTSVTGKPLYKGAAAPNRYGVRPGHRWDGVDRGNGFEKEYFAAQNRRQNARDLDYAWQMDE